jgi:2-octaprenyl-6-methoxyphenol hydroxylase
MRAEACDVVIAGGGPVGATLALALRGSGLAVTLVEPEAKPSDAFRPAFRPIALSHGSRMILERLGAFTALAATPITIIHVSQAGGFGRTVIRAEDEAVPALGYVCEGNALAGTLLGAVRAERCVGRVSSWRVTETAIRVTVDASGAQREIAARLLVLADGGQHAGDDLALRDYGQTAIVARVRAESPARGRAFERFTADGPLALLPFHDDDFALVWSAGTAQAARLAALDGERFLAALSARFGARLGRFVSAGPRVCYPLRLWYRRSVAVEPRVLAVGNAAQTLHPVAGQGLNLGLRDAFELAELARRSDRDDIGASAFVAAFQRARDLDRRAAIGATDFLARVFSNDAAWLRAARGASLAALDLFPPARRLLARRMMLGARGLP